MTRTLDDYDYYVLLGVTKEASADVVREAFHRFAAKYHPDHHVGQSPAVQAKAAQIYRRGAEAYRVLLHPRKRAEYDAQLELGGLRYTEAAQRTRASGAPRGAGAEPALTPEALRYIQEAEKAASAGNAAMARFHLSIAERKAPKHPRIEALKARL